MGRDYRVQVTLSPDVEAALKFQAAQSGMAPATLAGAMLFQALSATLGSREFQRHLREEREASNAADANEERRFRQRMTRAQEKEETWVESKHRAAHQRT